MTAGQPPLPEPIAVRVPEAARLIGLSRSRLYELMKRGEVEYVKVGGATLIPYVALRAFITRQPRVRTECEAAGGATTGGS